ncbi:MAG: DNA polymerase III subunit epsilon [Pseudomonadales bacterium]|nr:DNA polymerase III subunit epsilon [Pseudomonadales bacterium]MCP5183991.1 DNA polymerase III subunit epsilon [Pseudomonadales bacterium]
MRQVVLDTETTGLEAERGHRVIEIGAVEVVNRRVTRRHFHVYLNPERDIDPGAQEVHGLSAEFLADKPHFAEITEAFLDFITGAELIIHNAAFDVTFLDYELSLLPGGTRRIRDICTVTDSLAIARDKHPGQRNNLDALCRRYGVDNSARELHGALLDAEILADVYLAMTGGQVALFVGGEGQGGQDLVFDQPLVHTPYSLPVIEPDTADLAAHEALLALLDKECGERAVWRQFMDGA